MISESIQTLKRMAAVNHCGEILLHTRRAVHHHRLPHAPLRLTLFPVQSTALCGRPADLRDSSPRTAVRWIRPAVPIADHSPRHPLEPETTVSTLSPSSWRGSPPGRAG